MRGAYYASQYLKKYFYKIQRLKMLYVLQNTLLIQLGVTKIRQLKEVQKSFAPFVVEDVFQVCTYKILRIALK